VFAQGQAYQVGEVAGNLDDAGDLPRGLRAIPISSPRRPSWPRSEAWTRCSGPRGQPGEIGVVELNVHCGEGGMFGREEIRRPSPRPFSRPRPKGSMWRVPLPPTAPSPLALRGDYQGLVLMYHDQANIGGRSSGRDQPGVSLFLGMPVRW